MHAAFPGRSDGSEFYGSLAKVSMSPNVSPCQSNRGFASRRSARLPAEDGINRRERLRF